MNAAPSWRAAATLLVLVFVTPAVCACIFCVNSKLAVTLRVVGAKPDQSAE